MQPGLKILSVAYPFARVRSDTAGGAEQVLFMLDRALTLTGNQSYVVACEGSIVLGKLLPTPFPAGPIDDAVRRSVWSIVRTTLEQAIAQWKPDLVHMHGMDFFEYLPPPGVPVVATLHLPPAWYPPATFAIARPNTWLHCVSRSQEDACPKPGNLLPFIGNGVPEYGPAPNVWRRGFAISLGRICPEKGYHLAIAASHRAGVPFLLAGEVYRYEEHQRYFHEELAPHFNRCARFIGAVGPRKKRRLLTAARCVLIPSLAPETSSLVAMEAAMCGTAVVASRSGALPEIVQENVTGFLVDNVEQMAEAIHATRRIDPQTCRDAAMSRFSATWAAGEYLRMYRRLIRTCSK